MSSLSSLQRDRSALTLPLIGILGLLVLLTTYWGALQSPFIFDDTTAILGNETIKDIANWGAVFSPPANGGATNGRPIVNFSLALNYAVSGYDVRSYHFVNIVLHALVAVLLFDCVRRTLRSPRWRAESRHQAGSIALVVTLLWALHPLHSESVICIAQRTELLVGIFYLLTFCFFSRAAEEPHRPFWQVLAVVACLVGMGTKEVMVTAPVLIFLYDRTFFAGSFRSAWQARRGLYVGLAGSWLLLAWLVVSMGGTRGTAAGFGLGMTPYSYALKQCEALVLYIRLVAWPFPLVLDHGTAIYHSLADVWWEAGAIIILLGATAWGVVRATSIGFVGAWFFTILAPSSSIIPLIAQTVAEHRTYLPSMSLLACAVLALHRVIPQKLLPVALAGAALASLTARRTQDFASELTIWRDTVAKQPANARAHVNLGIALKNARRIDEAEREVQLGLRLEPNDIYAWNALGAVLLDAGRPVEALAAFDRVATLQPELAPAAANRGFALLRAGQAPAALAAFTRAADLNPKLAGAFRGKAEALVALGRHEEAILAARFAVSLALDAGENHAILGQALLRAGRLDDAILELEHAGRLSPADPTVQCELGVALYRTNRASEALPHFEAALRLKPDYFDALHNLASALAQTGRTDEAIARYREAAQLKPERADVYANLGLVLARAGSWHEAEAAFERVLALEPESPTAKERLAQVRALLANPSNTK